MSPVSIMLRPRSEDEVGGWAAEFAVQAYLEGLRSTLPKKTRGHGSPSLIANCRSEAITMGILPVFLAELVGQVRKTIRQGLCCFAENAEDEIRSDGHVSGKLVPVLSGQVPRIGLVPYPHGKITGEAGVSAGADQIVERCKVNAAILVKEGQVLGVTIRVSQQDIQNLPSDEFQDVRPRLVGDLPQHLCTHRQGRTSLRFILLT